MKRLRWLVALAFASLCLAQLDPSLMAWWLKAKFPPAETEYEGVQVNAIDPDWVKIKVLSFEAMPTEAKSDFGWMREKRLSFKVDEYFKRPGLEDREICGTYQTRSGKLGRFVMVLERKPSAPWKVVLAYQIPDEAGFSVLHRSTKGLLWGDCMQCDGDFWRIRLGKNGKYYIDSSLIKP